jgi:hypothetical protein
LGRGFKIVVADRDVTDSEVEDPEEHEPTVRRE